MEDAVAVVAEVVGVDGGVPQVGPQLQAGLHRADEGLVPQQGERRGKVVRQAKSAGGRKHCHFLKFV